MRLCNLKPAACEGALSGAGEYRAKERLAMHVEQAAALERQGNIDSAEAHLIEAYKICRAAEMLRQSVDLADRISRLLKSGADSELVRRKAEAWHELALKLRSQLV